MMVLFAIKRIFFFPFSSSPLLIYHSEPYSFLNHIGGFIVYLNIYFRFEVREASS